MTAGRAVRLVECVIADAIRSYGALAFDAISRVSDHGLEATPARALII